MKSFVLRVELKTKRRLVAEHEGWEVRWGSPLIPPSSRPLWGPPTAPTQGGEGTCLAVSLTGLGRPGPGAGIRPTFGRQGCGFQLVAAQDGDFLGRGSSFIGALRNQTPPTSCEAETSSTKVFRGLVLEE